MNDIYRKYYLSDDKVQEILNKGIIAFDTSALLDLYYYSSDTQKQIFDNVFKFLSNRLWIPSQVYYEYLKNKSKVAEKPIFSYETLISNKNKNDNGGYINKIVSYSEALYSNKIPEIKNQLKSLKEQTSIDKKHPYIPPNVYTDFEQQLAEFGVITQAFIENAKNFEKKFSEEIAQQVSKIRQGVIPDCVLEAIESNFQIGKEYTYEQMFQISQEGVYRYDNQIPPGYEDDSNKIGLQKYGDLFLWKQMLEYAEKKKLDFILVTNDVKNDWFDVDKKTPRFELLKEFNSQSNKSIWLLSMQSFMHKINVLLEEKLTTTTLDNINAVQEEQNNKMQKNQLSIDLLQSVFDNFLQEEIYLMDLVAQNEAIRLFNNPVLYEAEDGNGKKYRIIATQLGGSNYASMLHGITNALEIKKYYSANKENYKYYNFIITKSRELLDKCLEHLNKTKVRKMFSDKSICSLICYFEDGKLQIGKTNFID